MRARPTVTRDAALYLLLAACITCVAVAAEPSAPAQTAPPTPVAPQSVLPDRAASTPLAAKPLARKSLDLQPRNLERYFTRAQLDEPLQDPDDPDAVVVEGRRTDVPPDPEKQPVPGGIAAPFWALRHPTKAWRLFVPDPNAAPAGPPAEPVPPHRPFADP